MAHAKPATGKQAPTVSLASRVPTCLTVNAWSVTSIALLVKALEPTRASRVRLADISQRMEISANYVMSYAVSAMEEGMTVATSALKGPL